MRGLLILLLLLLALPAAAEERITHYGVIISIEANGDIIVQEDITVRAEHNKINRGIYRDLIALVPGGFGLLQAPLEIIDVRRNGLTEPWHTERKPAGLRVYIGDKSQQVALGVHTYSLTYRMGWQIRRFGDYDELYWNLTGNDWEFPIDHVSATITLPEGGNILQYAGYLGKRGDKGIEEQDFRLSRVNDTRLTIETLRPLTLKEGVTIALGFPKGIVPTPTPTDWIALLNLTNPAVPTGIIGLLILTSYFLLAWIAVGRDPPAGPVVPNYKPQASPGAMRYVRRMGFDQKALTAAILSLATKGYLRIEERDAVTTSQSGVIGALASMLAKTFVLVADDKGHDATEDELALHKSIFGSRKELILRQSNRAAIRGILQGYQRELERRFNRTHFVRNWPWYIGGFLLTALCWLAIAYLSGPQALGMGLFMAIWLGFWSMGTGFLIAEVFRTWKQVLTGSPWRMFGAIIITLFSLPFIAGWVMGAFFMTMGVGVAGTAFLIIAALLNVTFFQLLPAPTILGRQLLDEVEGTRLYLTVAEADRLRAFTPPDTPETFEKFLPYAIALDEETRWSDRFSAQLDALSQSQQAMGRSNTLPTRWYGRSQPLTTALASTISTALGTALASASASNSSGSGGGGRSGGGSGGGGGGGW